MVCEKEEKRNIEEVRKEVGMGNTEHAAGQVAIRGEGNRQEEWQSLQTTHIGMVWNK